MDNERRPKFSSPEKSEVKPKIELVFTEERPLVPDRGSYDYRKNLPEKPAGHRKLEAGEEVKVSNFARVILMLKRPEEDPKYAKFDVYLYERNDGENKKYEEGSYLVTRDINGTKEEIPFSAEDAAKLLIKNGETVFLGYYDEEMKDRRDSGDKEVYSGTLYTVLPNYDDLPKY
jgi:hypothetical protein